MPSAGRKDVSEGAQEEMVELERPAVRPPVSLRSSALSRIEVRSFFSVCLISGRIQCPFDFGGIQCPLRPSCTFISVY